MKYLMILMMVFSSSAFAKYEFSEGDNEIKKPLKTYQDGLDEGFDKGYKYGAFDSLIQLFGIAVEAESKKYGKIKRMDYGFCMRETAKKDLYKMKRKDIFKFAIKYNDYCKEKIGVKF